MKASKFFKLKQKWGTVSNTALEAVSETISVVSEVIDEEVVKPLETTIEEIQKPTKATIKKKKDETITE